MAAGAPTLDDEATLELDPLSRDTTHEIDIKGNKILQRQESMPRLLARGRHRQGWPHRSGAGARYRRLSEMRVCECARQRRQSKNALSVIRSVRTKSYVPPATTFYFTNEQYAQVHNKSQTARQHGRGNWVQCMHIVSAPSPSFTILPAS